MIFRLNNSLSGLTDLATKSRITWAPFSRESKG